MDKTRVTWQRADLGSTQRMAA